VFFCAGQPLGLVVEAVLSPRGAGLPQRGHRGAPPSHRAEAADSGSLGVRGEAAVGPGPRSGGTDDRAGAPYSEPWNPWRSRGLGPRSAGADDGARPTYSEQRMGS